MRFLYLQLLLLFSLHSTAFAEPLNVSVKSESAVLMNAATGKILFAKNASKKQYPASITKVATCIYALNQGSHLLDKRIEATIEALRCVSSAERAQHNYTKHPAHWLETGASHIGLKNGEIVPFRDLLYGMMLASGGDASNVIAEYFGNGSIPLFMQNVNRYLQSIGCSNTYFCNPSGLHHPEHMTTALDVAKMCQEALKNPLFCQIVKTSNYTKAATNKQPQTTFVQSNRLVKKGLLHYPYAIGVKTGYTSKAQHTLVAAAEKDHRLLIAVLLNCPERQEKFLDAKNLFEKAFSETKVEKIVLPAGSHSFSKPIEDAAKPLTVYSKDALNIAYYPSEEPSLRLQLVWDKALLPIQAGQKVGALQLLADDRVVQTAPLYAKEMIEASWWASVKRVGSSPISLIALCAIVLLLSYELTSRKRS
ncbi:MAG: dacC [Chlamydiia bacterium]|nr:dacC [Chlamydiia bacterium]